MDPNLFHYGLYREHPEPEWDDLPGEISHYMAYTQRDIEVPGYPRVEPGLADPGAIFVQPFYGPLTNLELLEMHPRREERPVEMDQE